MRKKIDELMEKFGCEGNLAHISVFKSGHINTTFLVVVDEGGQLKKYVFQKINTNVFKNPEAVMENIAGVTGFIKNKLESNGINSARKVLNFKQAPDGNYFVIDDNGGYWRVYDFVDNSVTFNEADNAVLYETGQAFGEFQTMLSDYPSAELYETIPNFHNTPKRYETFKSVVRQNPVGRVDGVRNECYKYLELEKIASRMQHLLDAGQLPLRVTHNDTKCNNVLFDEKTRKHLCVIDLDTVMPGLVGFDFGDAMRFAGNTCAEDEKDLDKVKIDLDKFDAFTHGFLDSVGSALTKNEIDTLVLGAITMTTECGLRFLTDYIDGDNYFKVDYPEQNLDRARCQLKLAIDMIGHSREMQEIVDKWANNRVKAGDDEQSADE